jgi:WD40 repeat protein
VALRPFYSALFILASTVHCLRAADEPVQELPKVPFAHDCAVGAVAFAPDGVHLVSGADDGVIRVWNRETGLKFRELTGHRGRVSSLSFSPNGKLLASGSGDQTVGIWDFASGKLLHRCQGHDGWVRSVQFSPAGKLVASGSYDQTVRLWDPATGKELRRIEDHEAPVSAVSFAPDGKTLAAGDHDNVGRLWDTATGKQVRLIPKQKRGEMTGIAVCGGGRIVVTGSANGNLLMWATDTGELLRHSGTGAAVLSLTASPDGKLFLAGSSVGNLYLYEAASRDLILAFPGYQGDWNPVKFFPTTGVATAIHALAFSGDGAWVAAGTKDGRIRVWRLADLLNGSDKPQKLRPEDLDSAWTELAAPEPLAGCRALVRLTTGPELALPYLTARLCPTPRLDVDRVRKLVAALDDDDFDVRERATADLSKYSEAVCPLLRDTLRGGKLSPEAANRVRQLLVRLDGTETPPERLREARVLQSLEWMATPAARALLADLAKGQPGSPLTEEAAQALVRLGRRDRP